MIRNTPGFPIFQSHPGGATTRMSAQALYQAEDWTDFRTLDTLGRRAGVPVEDLPRVVVKELVDNAYDAGANCEFGTRCDALGNDTIYVSDDGPGMPGSPQDIACWFR
jgi:hypothetical protein